MDEENECLNHLASVLLRKVTDSLLDSSGDSSGNDLETVAAVVVEENNDITYVIKVLVSTTTHDTVPLGSTIILDNI